METLLVIADHLLYRRLLPFGAVELMKTQWKINRAKRITIKMKIIK